MKAILKILKYLIIAIVVLLILLITAPFLFKGKIMTEVQHQINKNVNAKVEFADFNLSMLKGFPNLSVSLEDLKVVGVDTFKTDTLMQFDKFEARVNLISAIKMENIKIRSVILEKPKIHVIMLNDSLTNFDIMKETGEPGPQEKEDTAAGGEMNFNVALKRFAITDADIRFTDYASGMTAVLNDWDFELNGDMSKDLTTIELSTQIAGIDFKSGGIRYMNNASFSFIASLSADMANHTYTMQKNEIRLNDLVLGINGSVQMPPEKDMAMDLSIKTKKTDFKTLLSLVPAIYKNDFSDVQTKGSLALNGNIKGMMGDERMPNADMELVVENAMFKYPDLPKSVENININTKLHFDGTNNDNTTIDVNRFHVELAGNPIDAVLHLATPISDPQVESTVKGKLDLASLADVVPMEGMKIKGFVNSNIAMAGRMSYIEQEQYEQFKAEGSVELSAFSMQGEDLPGEVIISHTLLNFSPQYVELADFNAQIGQSDFYMNGKIENFIAYFLDKETGVLKGNFNFRSNNINVNEFMSEEPAEQQAEAAPEDTTPMSVVEVPGDLDFRLTTNIGHLLYDKLDISDIDGLIELKEGRMLLSRLNMNLLEGSMEMNGEYNTRDVRTPKIDFAMAIKRFDIPSAFHAFEVVQKLAPIAKNCEGRFSADLTIASALDKHMNPAYNTMSGAGTIASDNIKMNNSKTFNKISSVLKIDKYKTMELEDVEMHFEIKEGRVFVDPFDVKAGKTKMTVSGDQGIDQSLNYNIDMKVPKSLFGSQANKVVGDLISKAGAEGINIDRSDVMDMAVAVSGMMNDPEVNVKFTGAEGTATSVKEQATEKVKEKIDKTKDEAKAKAREQAEKIMKEAEKKAEQIRKAGKRSAQKVRDEADDKADMLVKEANNPIAKAAAKKAAEKIRKEADEKADKIEREADQNADKVLREARKKADKLN